MTNLQLSIIPRTLHFKQPAGTSRGVYLTRKVWYVVLTDTGSGRKGIGECAPLPRLSCDDLPNYEAVLTEHARRVAETGQLDERLLRNVPSIRFGLETALRHLQTGSLRLWETPFSRGAEGIPINGLVWMGSFEEMAARMEEKMKAGFRCIKLKIGAIDFEQELELLRQIRRHFPPGTIEIRVDANGAFSPEEAPARLRQLAVHGLHSIEQPIRAGQWEALAALCRNTPIPIALDEELIGIHTRKDKAALLDTVRPQHIVLKPSLHGGWQGSQEWIELAAARGIGYWITSALESNVGLNAIAQWCATLHPACPQGLGTGQLFTDNIDIPLHIHGDCLWFSPTEEPADGTDTLPPVQP